MVIIKICIECLLHKEHMRLWNTANQKLFK